VRTVAYGFFLVLLFIGGLLLLRSIEPAGEDERPVRRLAKIVGHGAPAIDLEHLPAASAEDIFQLGVEYLQMWRVREATEILERAVAADSTHHDAWLRLIECYAHPLVDDEEAVHRAARRAAATATSAADTLLVVGLRALYEEHDYAQAITALANVARGKDGPARGRYHLAVAYFQLGRFEDASKQLDRLLRQDATVGPVAELSIRRAVAAGEFTRAGEDARELARLFPEEAHPYVLIAQVELARGHAAEAVDFCNNALQIDPGCVPAILTRACLYANEGDLASARVSYEKLMLFDDLTLASIGHEGIAFVDFLAGDFEEGIDGMDEAIRHAMLAGSHGRALDLASRLVAYLCQLGQADAAEGVVERWVTGFGDFPVRLARARIQVLQGDFDSSNDVITHVTTEKEWMLWARMLSLDVTELAALTEIGQERQTHALALLEDARREAVEVRTGSRERRTFLAGYAAFQTGDAESAAADFAEVRARFFGPEFPYHGDPVLYVQALFFLAEAELARGNRTAAREHYEAFLTSWGEAAWDLEAVARTHRRLETLSEPDAPPQG
jgi:tetratricopeptide (TPR) repeat protein